jgi:ankyrin repeat protein
MGDNATQAAAVVQAIRKGDIEALQRILSEEPDLVKARIDGQRTLLHIATDWPGHFPNNVASICALLDHGAGVNAAFSGRHSETPLHWAASTGDVAVIDVLLDRGADIEAPGGVIGSGAPLADAVAFGQWQAAHRLVERGARTTLWQAAALGLMSRVQEYFESDPAPAPVEVTNAFWCACHGGQRAAAEYLLGQGADLNWVGYDGLTPAGAASRGNANDLVEWLRSRGARSNHEQPTTSN